MDLVRRIGANTPLPSEPVTHRRDRQEGFVEIAADSDQQIPTTIETEAAAKLEGLRIDRLLVDRHFGWTQGRQADRDRQRLPGGEIGHVDPGANLSPAGGAVPADTAAQEPCDQRPVESGEISKRVRTLVSVPVWPTIA